VDVALDTFPYNGTTTTREALFMGVPIVKLAGKVHLSRMGVSLLTTLGLQELIAHTLEIYVALAVGLAQDAFRRPALKKDLRSSDA